VGLGIGIKPIIIANKKPEMPITGFEYLEKIVHVPFRLPPLGEREAVAFMGVYEAAILTERAKQVNDVDRPEWIKAHTWFAPRLCALQDKTWSFFDTSAPTRENPFPWATQPEKPDEFLTFKLNLAWMVVKSFDVYVPRKLIRVIELFHQVHQVLGVRKDSLDTNGMAVIRSEQLRLGGSIDPRLLLAFLLLQLFQPELYRSLRRTITGFEELLDSFQIPSAAQVVAIAQTKALSSVTSDVDLMHWAVYWVDAIPPVSHRAMTLRVAALAENLRHPAQRRRILLVEKILEHRAAQRHVFDPLKLFEQLAKFKNEEPKMEVQASRFMFSLLAQSMQTPEVGTDNDVIQRVTELTTVPTNDVNATDAYEATSPVVVPTQDVLSSHPKGMRKMVKDAMAQISRAIAIEPIYRHYCPIKTQLNSRKVILAKA
jgi:KAP family P-loop domain